MIILLSAGEPSKAETSTVIKQAITAGKQLAGPVVVLAFGLDTGQKTYNFFSGVFLLVHALSLVQFVLVLMMF